MKSGFQDDGWAPLSLTDATVDSCIPWPDLGQQQRAISKHHGSAEVRGTAGGREYCLEEALGLLQKGDEVEFHIPRVCAERRVLYAPVHVCVQVRLFSLLALKLIFIL